MSEQGKKALLLFNEVKVINANVSEIQEILALFDIGSQLSFVSKKSANQLEEIEREILEFFSFNNKTPRNKIRLPK